MTHQYADHTWFEFRDQSSQPMMNFGEDILVGIHLIVHVQAFHIGSHPPLQTPGLLDRPYPDVTNWSQRKVGLRDGLARICHFLDGIQLPASFIVEADAIDEIQEHMSSLQHARHSIIAGGKHAAFLHSQFDDINAEVSQINQVMKSLSMRFDNLINAWRSPFGVQSPNTLDALAQSGVHYTLDFNNDDSPYPIDTDGGSLLSVPYQHFSSDLHCLHVAKQEASDYLKDLSAGVSWLQDEAKLRGPKLLTVPLHPWIIGAPHRFAALKSMLNEWNQDESVRFVGTREIIESVNFQPRDTVPL